MATKTIDCETIKEKFSEIRGKYNIDFDLKEEQINIACSLINGRNALGLLPTGFGKTLCIAIPTMMMVDKNPITLVISPLTSLMDDQIGALEAWTFTCAKIGPLSEMDSSVISGIKNGNFQFVFSSPESALKLYWKNVYSSSVWQARLSLIAIDEAHCITEWGEDFRTEFRQLVELRSFFRAPVLALTATTTRQVKDEILQHLNLTEDKTDVVFKSPNRPNIFLEVLKRESPDYEVSLKWLIDHIRCEGEHSKKIVVYCRSIDTVSEIFLTIKLALGLDAYANKIQEVAHLLVEMYHKSTHSESKARILSEFKKRNSQIRCLIATVALGMGVDVRDIDMVVHIGCPKSVISYWQEAGRCARDGRQGYALIIYDNFTLSMKSTGKGISDIIKNDDQKCIRQQIVDFLTVGERIVLQADQCNGCNLSICLCGACKCCSACSRKCLCSERVRFDYNKFLQCK